jgi:hypothetical protein
MIVIMISAETDYDNGVKGGGILEDEGHSPARFVMQQRSTGRYVATVENPAKGVGGSE